MLENKPENQKQPQPTTEKKVARGGVASKSKIKALKTSKREVSCQAEGDGMTDIGRAITGAAIADCLVHACEKVLEEKKKQAVCQQQEEEEKNRLALNAATDPQNQKEKKTKKEGLDAENTPRTDLTEEELILMLAERLNNAKARLA